LRTFHQLKTNDFDDGLMIIGVYSSFLIPREEEPQIIVPMADVMVGYPGASPTEVESETEKIISNIKG
jgi:multidrug efflux pump subunit AcrB